MANEHFKMKIWPEAYADYSKFCDFMDEEMVYMDTVVLRQAVDDINEEIEQRRVQNASK